MGDTTGLLHITENQRYDIEKQRASSFPMQFNIIVDNHSIINLPLNVHVYGYTIYIRNVCLNLKFMFKFKFKLFVFICH